jgi:hypothetical protein
VIDFTFFFASWAFRIFMLHLEGRGDLEDMVDLQDSIYQDNG